LIVENKSKFVNYNVKILGLGQKIGCPSDHIQHFTD